MHKTMFIMVDGERVQCVIKPQHEKQFIKLGFVDNVDKIEEEKPKRVARKKAD